MSTILLTGVTGYIGSHTALALLRLGYQVVGVDNFSNSKPIVLSRILALTGKEISFYEGDILDGDLLDRIFTSHNIDAVIHFAGLKSVSESISKPIDYYKVNVAGTTQLCNYMNKHHVKKLVFSSSATVYGANAQSPIPETAKRETINPYGETKLVCEKMLEAIAVSDSTWSIVLLRYFNPVGADESGELGESPNGTPNNLMPYVTQVALGKRDKLYVFGDDYPTKDGSGVRDFIHVTDLAQGHCCALPYVMSHTGIEAVNLGTGAGYSVLEIVESFKEHNSVVLPYEIVGRREGDSAECFADPQKAKTLFNFSATKTLEDIVRDSYRWQTKNPDGF